MNKPQFTNVQEIYSALQEAVYWDDFDAEQARREQDWSDPSCYEVEFWAALDALPAYARELAKNVVEWDGRTLVPSDVAILFQESVFDILARRGL